MSQALHEFDAIAEGIMHEYARAATKGQPLDVIDACNGHATSGNPLISPDLDAARRRWPYSWAMAVNTPNFAGAMRWWWRPSNGEGAGRCCTL